METNMALSAIFATNLAMRSSFLNSGFPFTHLLNGSNTNNSHYNNNEVMEIKYLALSWCLINTVKTKHASNYFNELIH